MQETEENEETGKGVAGEGIDQEEEGELYGPTSSRLVSL